MLLLKHGAGGKKLDKLVLNKTKKRGKFGTEGKKSIYITTLPFKTENEAVSKQTIINSRCVR